MAFETWIGFVAAAAVILAIPGPTILLVIGQSIGTGRNGAWPLVIGVAAGDLVAMSLSLAGLGAILATSATAFTVLKWAGAAYLVWLGVSLWRAKVPGDVPGAGEMPPARDAVKAARASFVVTALNPKSIAFFVAFVPLFIDPASPFLPQALVLVATFVTMAGLNASLYALLAARMSAAVRRPRVRRWFNRAGGAMLVGAGAATAGMRQG
jgi:threonine/homoserine/homoserine lactone efflux protein